MSYVKILVKDFSVLRGCLMYKLNSRIIFGKENCSFKLQILRRNTSGDSRLSIPKPFVSDRLVTRLKKRDKIPDGFTLIYRVRRSISFSVAHLTAILLAFTSPAFLITIGARNDFKLPIVINNQIVVASKIEIFALLFISTGLIIAILNLVSRFPFRIYHNKRTGDYIAAFSNILLPWKTNQVKFKKGQVTVIPKDELWTVQFSNYKLNGKKVIFHDDRFEKPLDLEQMVGDSKAWLDQGEK